MASKIPEKIHVRHCMPLEFHKGSNATVATKNICDVYPSALDIRNVAEVAEWYRYRTVACFVTSSSPVPLKTRGVGQRCALNLSRAETSSRWCGVVVREGVPAQVSSTSLDHGSKLRGPSPKSPRVAEQCDVNIQSINRYSSMSKMVF
ncbi:uncharacterized protein TNCV_3886521 [Trichonephila clavipes]|nr:uncharacterized protein TNCV_3886521 [Trichonephila clavipes]